MWVDHAKATIFSAFCPGNETGRRTPYQPRRPADFKPFTFPPPRELREKYSDAVMAQAAKLMQEVDSVNTAGKYKPTWESLDTHPMPDWFLDAKFGMFVDWGLYSIPAYAPKGYPDWYLHRMMGDTQKYHDAVWGADFRQDDFIPLFTASEFDAEYMADIARVAGMKYVVPFLKHHDGYCLWNSSFTLRNTAVMGPKRDLAQEWAQACRKRNLKFGFYYSIDDWFYPVIEANGQLAVRTWYCKPRMQRWTGNPGDWDRRMLSGKIPVRNFYTQYINPAAIEFFNQYDPDIFWGDGDWVYDLLVMLVDIVADGGNLLLITNLTPHRQTRSIDGCATEGSRLLDAGERGSDLCDAALDEVCGAPILAFYAEQGWPGCVCFLSRLARRASGRQERQGKGRRGDSHAGFEANVGVAADRQRTDY
jgi:Alpha-L-fucosidase